MADRDQLLMQRPLSAAARDELRRRQQAELLDLRARLQQEVRGTADRGVEPRAGARELEAGQRSTQELEFIIDQQDLERRLRAPDRARQTQPRSAAAPPPASTPPPAPVDDRGVEPQPRKLERPTSEELAAAAREIGDRFGYKPATPRAESSHDWRARFNRWVIATDPQRLSIGRRLDELAPMVERIVPLLVAPGRSQREVENIEIGTGIAFSLVEDVAAVIDAIVAGAFLLIQEAARLDQDVRELVRARDSLIAFRHRLRGLLLGVGQTPLRLSVAGGAALVGFVQDLLRALSEARMALNEGQPFRYGRAAGHFATAVAGAVSVMSDLLALSSRVTFRPVYNDLVRNGYVPRGATRSIFPEATGTRYPSVEIRPNGDVFGTYEDLIRYVRETGLSGSRLAGESSIEVHHLLEDRVMEQFGIPRASGRSVALEWSDHSVFTAEVERWLPRGRRFHDIDEIFEGHAKVYRAHGYSEWVDEMRRFLREHRAGIEQMYSEGQVPGADLADFPARLERVRRFLSEL